ncbi:sensor domain-containing diguanylate cyclase [Halarcobacter ebronensis]|uniref:diguanylate cyclase n=1 Tax=Halarcobacter ebronensis TaxID=1462615 RepID=A0A4Q1AEZ6_9BACT|nr:sensor domain-containing diguanylate cyclase [Halarcobacter ebronensis]QKF82644.1 Cache sensor-containing diguanylate cyclase [Halarcobacter ebronensis]RXK02067.1 hypothetical protein CRV07_14230 [Halarcobacter ebronensis]
MDQKLKKSSPYIVGFLILLFIFSSYLIYKNEVYEFKKNSYYNTYRNVEYLKEYFTISESFLYSMKYTIEDKLKLECNCSHPSYINLQYNKEKDIYTITNIKGIEGESSLCGIGNPKTFKQESINEINSSLYLKPIFLAAKDVIFDLKRVYYKSLNEFVFIYPDFTFQNSKTLKKLYECKEWKKSIEKMQTNNNFILTDLIKDRLADGYIITLMIPIKNKNRIKGAVGIDIELNTFNDFISALNLKGETYIINDKNRVIASKNKNFLNSTLDTSNKDFIKYQILENQLSLVHIIDNFELFKNAFLNSIGKILILFLLISILIILIYLRILSLKLQHLANTDSLTNLLNRRAIESAINKQIEISRRYKQPLSFLLIDIDHFKKFNDSYGHDIGDEVLVKISNLFRYLIRSCDIVGRIGGEEFLISLANTNLDEAYILAERIRKLVNEITIDNINMNITVSIGCTTLNKNDTYKTIFKRVDTLMYEAKKGGRDNTIKR